MSNALLSLIRAASGDRATVRAEYIAAFSSDLDEVVKANNKDSITRALQNLAKGDKWQALGAAITGALTATVALLPDNAGWIGAARGSFTKQPAEVRAPYLAARAEGVAVFTSALEASDLWRDITEADKAEEKAKREAKKAEREALAAEEKAKATEAEINARIASGELVARDSVHLIGDFAACALIEELKKRELSADDVQALGEILANARRHAEALAA